MIELPGYDYLGPLGEPGNFGSVFRARNHLSGLEVAIKHIDAEMTPEALQDWIAEAQAMAACKHDHLVSIFHAEITADGPAIVMEYLPEGSAAGRFGTTPAPVNDVVDLSVDVCWGLHRLHVAGLTHRDIKPANILYQGRRAKLGDFGLTRAITHPVDLAYTPHTAPEIQHGGEWLPTADVYALSVTAWRLLTGDSSNGRLEDDFIERLQAGTWPNRDVWPPHVHTKLRNALKAGMHPDAAKRPGSAADLRGRLEAARPAVSWIALDEHYWEGIGPTAVWRVTADLSEGGGAMKVETTKDSGNGPRRVKNGCAKNLSRANGMNLLEQNFNTIAATGDLAT